MRAFGADVEIVPSDGGKVTPALFDRFKARIAELTQEPNTFWTDQFHNADALDGYANIGRELAEQVGTVDAFVGAVGTAGMLVGVSRALKAGRQPGAHRRAGAVDIAVPDHRQGRRASRRRARRRDSGRRTDRRTCTTKRAPSMKTRPRDGAARRRRKKASSRARRAA